MKFQVISTIIIVEKCHASNGHEIPREFMFNFGDSTMFTYRRRLFNGILLKRINRFHDVVSHFFEPILDFVNLKLTYIVLYTRQ